MAGNKGGRGIRAARAYVEVFLDKSGVTRGLKFLGRQLRSFGSIVRKAGGGLLALGGGAAAALAFPIKAASDLQETLNKFDVVFGKNRGAVKAWGDEFAKRVGRSKRQVADFLAGSQDLLVPMGLDPATATETSKQLTALAVDLASFNNMADADVLRDLHAALTGSGEVMKKYGVIVSQAAVNQELLNSGLDPKTATEATKAQARLSIIMRGTTAAQGDAIRSAGSWANQQKRLIGLLEDFAAAVGGPLLDVLTPVLTTVADIVAAGAKWAAGNPGLVTAILGVTAATIALGAGLTGLGVVLPLIAAGLGALFSPLGLLVGVLGAATGALIKFGGASQVVDWLRGKLGPLLDRAKETFTGIKRALAAGDFELAARILWLSLKTAWQNGTDALSKVWDGFADAFFASLADMAIGLNRFWNSAVKRAAGVLLPVFAKLQGVSVDDARAELDRQFEQKNADLDQLRKTAARRRQAIADRRDEKRNAPEQLAERKQLRDELAAALAEAQQLASDDDDAPTPQEISTEAVDQLVAGLTSGRVAAAVTASATAADLQTTQGANQVVDALNAGNGAADQLQLLRNLDGSVQRVEAAVKKQNRPTTARIRGKAGS